MHDMILHPLVFSFFTSLIINCLAIKIITPILISKKILDLPNQRSSHILPTPKGAGIVIIASFIILYHFYFGFNGYYFSLAIILLTIISFINDLKQLSPLIRLSSHVIAVLIVIFLFEQVQELNFVYNLLPIWLSHILVCISVLWFINLFNFMDGIDGITGTQCIIMGTGASISLLSYDTNSILLLFISGFLIGSAFAFLLWNWHPAKVFLGDAGSIPLGLISAVLMLLLCRNNLWFCAFMLCNYYLIDSTFTLVKRLLYKKKLWQAHKEHFYQIAVQNGMSHETVCKLVAFHGFLMIILSLISSYFNSNTIIGICLILSILSSMLLVFCFLNKKNFGKSINE